MRQSPRQKHPPRPLDGARLDELALSYVARFATSAAKLEAYLQRKLRERGWEGEGTPPIETVVNRMVEFGYVDDTVYARAKSGSLMRRGYGTRRVDQALNAAGIAADLREEVRAGKTEQRRAALALLKRRKFGPFGDRAQDRAVREKQLSAMLRAGHPLDMARELVNAASIDAAERWAGEEEDY
ncbi:regulatory protein RecX [Novosphingobium aquae]|uniref:Regulatory protein RecX n=1 Tax=Novosphingobium aquae TaxID=3133435 RepID=A0ABU8SCS1_9SPHN